MESHMAEHLANQYHDEIQDDGRAASADGRAAAA
jgi:hypothetical protein